MLKKIAIATIGFVSAASSLRVNGETRPLTGTKPDFNQFMDDPDLQELAQDDKIQGMINNVLSGGSVDFSEMSKLLANPAVQSLANKVKSGDMGDLSSLMQSFDGMPDLLMASHPDFHLNGMPAINEMAADVIGQFLEKQGSEMKDSDNKPIMNW